MENQSLTGIDARFRVSQGSFISLGYSPSALLALFITSSIAFCLPVFLGFRKLKGDMVAGGSNSLVMSAACHVPYRSIMQQNPADTGNSLRGSSKHTRTLISAITKSIVLNNNRHFAPYHHITAPLTTDEANTSPELLRELAENKLRWGATFMSQDLVESTWINDGQERLQLGFGGREHDIREPEDGHYYV